MEEAHGGAGAAGIRDPAESVPGAAEWGKDRTAKVPARLLEPALVAVSDACSTTPARQACRFDRPCDSRRRPESAILIRPQYRGVRLVSRRIRPHANSSRLNSLMRAGKLYLTVQDAIALAIENNLGLEIDRYGPLLAQSALERAQAGGPMRGVPSASAQVSSVNCGRRRQRQRAERRAGQEAAAAAAADSGQRGHPTGRRDHAEPRSGPAEHHHAGAPDAAAGQHGVEPDQCAGPIGAHDQHRRCRWA